MRCWSGICALGLTLIAGCNESSSSDLEVVAVKGIVTLDDQPLASADVTAFPVQSTPGLGGATRSNEQGEFELTHVRGEKGLPIGDYKVTVSLRKRPNGSVPPLNDPTPPIESDAVETLSPRYSDMEQTILGFTVAAEPRPLELKLKSSK